MKSGIIHASAIAVCVAGISLSAANAQNVQQVGSDATADTLEDALAPSTPDQIGKTSRGLRAHSGKTPGMTAGPSSGGGHAESPRGSQAPAVALDIKFAVGSDQLTDSARDTIERIGTALKSERLASYRFRVEGHTDSSGDPDRNKALSERRAEAVKSYLVATDGINADRLEAVGKGSSEPLDAEHPASGVNRRVQIVNLGQ